MGCAAPFYDDRIVDFNGDRISIPCGRCFSCRLDLQRMACDRMFVAWHSHDCAAYVTFTYDDDHLIINDGYREATLSKDDVHKYLDKIKHQLKGIDFEYYLCGEYGDSFARPHYHALFFGLDYQLHASFFKRSWKKGSVKVLPVTSGAFRYLSKYITMPVSREYNDCHYYDFGIIPPFRKMSRGLGLKVYRQHLDELQHKGFFYYYGRKISLNRYYFNKMLLHNDTLILARELQKNNYDRKLSNDAFSHGLTKLQYVETNRVQKENQLISKNLNKKSNFY